MTAPSRATPFVDGVGVALWLLRDGLPRLREPLGLPAVKVFEDRPDQLSKYLPAVQVYRSGGVSGRPRFTSQFFLPLHCWSAAEQASGDRPAWDKSKAAFELANQVATVLYTAWEDQIVTPYGSVQHWRESTGFRKLDDPELPYVSRQVGVVDLRIRNTRAPRTP